MEEVTKLDNEILIQIPKHQSTPKEPMDRSVRKSLQTLQASPSGNGLNGGKNCIKDITKNVIQGQKDQSGVNSRSLTIYQDDQVANSSSIHCSRATQTEKKIPQNLHRLKAQTEDEDNGGDSAYFDQEAFDLMANENIPESYWKDLAEERRRALEESLDENRRLSLENSQLKEENSRLSDVAQEAKELRELLEGVLEDDDSAIKLDDPTETEDSLDKEKKSEGNAGLLHTDKAQSQEETPETTEK